MSKPENVGNACEIWTQVAKEIVSNLKSDKGVVISSFGTFIIENKSIYTSSQGIVPFTRPIFILSEKIVQTHQLNYNRPIYVSNINVKPLNLSSLSRDLDIERCVIEDCINETILTLNRTLAQTGKVEFRLKSLGKLIIRDNCPKMKFYKSFVKSINNQVDHSEYNNIMDYSSLITYKTNSTFQSRSTVVLPRFNKPKPLPNDNLQKDKNIFNSECTKQDIFDQNENYKFNIPTASFTVYDCESQKTAPRLSLNELTLKPTQNKVNNDILTINEKDFDNIDIFENKNSINLNKIPNNLPKIDSIKSESVAASTCEFHSSGGQELCYLCHQKNRKNVYVSFSEQKRQQDTDEDELYQKYNEMVNTEYYTNKKNSELEKRKKYQQQAAYNLGIAEALHNEKNKNSEHKSFNTSYVFHKRNITPIQVDKQKKYLNDLIQQIKLNEGEKSQQKIDNLKEGQIEQKWIKESIEKERKNAKQLKFESQEKYRNALKIQENYKQKQRDKMIKLNDILNKRDCPFSTNRDDTEPNALKRQRAYNVYLDQLNAIKEKNIKYHNGIMNEINQDAMLVKKNMEDVKNERINKYIKQFLNRKGLEDSWLEMNDLKKKREEDEHKFDKIPPDLRLLEQCDKYKRCKQCQRNVKNIGETNIWRDSYYLPGARMMV
ncbi:Coiled-coil domain-containing protein 81 [Intoshia linei]|uniref:Coiled-coil domain-containing protein 81 n=1 Tax=Intoshia linei TaxID=1819745 RepID=A0A177BAJ3_9BILA|nr:Coiled-coil domain-containing protein 81 [Intoshia linei]